MKIKLIGFPMKDGCHVDGCDMGINAINDNCKLEVMDVIKAPNGQHLLYVKVLDGTVNKGDKILTHVLKEKRL